MTLESEAVTVEFFVAQLRWETGSELTHKFQLSFGKFAPVFLDSASPSFFKLGKSREKEGSYAQLYIRENTILSFQTQLLNAGYWPTMPGISRRMKWQW